MELGNKVMYQIYPKSFYDANGDGIGDIKGVTEKIPYLQKLGVDMVWLSPFYPSPQRDNGYDVADYRSIDPALGTMADFTALVEKAEKHGIGIMIDLVFNHSSIAHKWFQKALQGDEDYKNYYICKKGAPDRPPTNWQSKFGGSAWEKWPGTADEYYLHLFDVTQADFNWENPRLRQELYGIVRFWMDLGVKGLRFDVVNLISKPEVWEDDHEGDGRRFYTDGPKVHQYLKEMNQETFGQKEIITVGEMSSTAAAHCVRYSGKDAHELDMVFHFHHLKTDYPQGEKWALGKVDFEMLKDIFHTWQKTMAEHHGWEALFWNNHDQPRALSRFGFDEGEARYYGATLLAATIHFMRGTPFIYMGEEIGMVNPGFECIEDYADVESHNHYHILKAAGYDEKTVMEIVKSRSRDNARVPMQWHCGDNAGFTQGTPWMKVAPQADIISVEVDLNAPKSIFSFYQELIRLRKQHAVIQKGGYAPLLAAEENVLAYQRTYENQALVSIHHYGKEEKNVPLTKILAGYKKAAVLLCNYGDKGSLAAEKDILLPMETITFLCEL